MRALDRKLLRDLGRMRAQAAAIALVAASGVALFLATVTTARSLRGSEQAYYERQRFAHVWSRLARAPRSITRDVAAVPGVAAVEGRLVSEAILDVTGIDEPVTGLLVSIPATSGHDLNDLYVRRGRHPEPGQAGEVLVSEAFADTNDLRLGAVIPAVAAGQRVVLRVVGVALSPEFVMQVPPGSLMPDDRRFGVFWMPRAELEALLDLRDAINEVTLRVARGASEPAVISAVDRLLQPYGGRGAYGRRSQMSHVQLEEHIRQLDALALIVPSIFLAVAAFLVNVVLSRFVGVQRSQIGMLKAFGYSNARIALHYLELALLIVVAGVVVGFPIGVWLGRVMTEFYGTFFRFPVLVFRVEPIVAAVAAVGTIGASAAGALGTLKRAVMIPPVVAMLPAPPAYRRTIADRTRVMGWFTPATRMIVRTIARRPGRALLVTAGMSLAVAVLVLGESSVDAIDRTLDVQFRTAQREDLSIVLRRPQALAVVPGLQTLVGVRLAEPYRAVPARVHIAVRQQDVTLLALASGSRLRRIVDLQYEEVAAPSAGVLVSAWLAAHLNIHRGDALALEIRERERRVVDTRVVGTVDEALGSFVYMTLEAAGRLLGEPDQFSAVDVLVDPGRQQELYAALKRAPEVLAVPMRRVSLANVQSMTDTTMDFVRRVAVVFSIIIAFGVVYNSTRIALAERGYELATLRVLGFTRGEISTALLGEIGLLALVAVPVGLAIGYGLSAVVMTAMSSERFRVPIVVEPATYAYAMLVFAIAACASAFLVRRHLDHLDLIEVLKARE